MGQLETVPTPKPRVQLGNCETACRHVTLVAPAEASCKELMDGIVRAIREGKIDRLQKKIVIVLNPKTFSSSETLMPANAILGNLYSRSDDVEMLKGFEWMIKHPNKVVFVIYSLNDFYPDLLHKRPLIRPFIRSKGDVILHNILSGNLFSEARIISSVSRNEKQPVRSIHISVLPDHCLILEGMTKNSTVLPIKELFAKDEVKEKDAEVTTYESLFQDDSAKKFIQDLQSGKGFTIPDKEAKRKILMKVLKDKLVVEFAEERRLEFYHDLYEGRAGSVPVIQEAVKEIDLSELPLHMSDIFPVAFIVGNSKRLRILNLRRCELDDEKVSRIANAALDSSVKIEEIDFSGNRFAPRTMLLIGRMAAHCRTKILRIWDCGLEHKHMDKLVEATPALQLTELDIRSNDLHMTGMYFLGKFVSQCKVRTVDASNSRNSDATSLRDFVDGMGDAKLDTLLLTDLTLESTFCVDVLNVMPLVKKELCLRGWRINDRARQEMASKLNEMKPTNLKVHLSRGVELKADGK